MKLFAHVRLLNDYYQLLKHTGCRSFSCVRGQVVEEYLCLHFPVTHLLLGDFLFKQMRLNRSLCQGQVMPLAQLNKHLLRHI